MRISNPTWVDRAKKLIKIYAVMSVSVVPVEVARAQIKVGISFYR